MSLLPMMAMRALLARAAFLAGYYEALQGVAEAQEYVLNNAAHPQEVTP